MPYHIEVRPEKGDIVLYMAERYRGMHDGPFTESFRNRLTWRRVETARKKIRSERERGRNRVHGRLRFSVVEEPEG